MRLDMDLLGSRLSDDSTGAPTTSLTTATGMFRIPEDGAQLPTIESLLGLAETTTLSTEYLDAVVGNPGPDPPLGRGSGNEGVAGVDKESIDRMLEEFLNDSSIDVDNSHSAHPDRSEKHPNNCPDMDWTMNAESDLLSFPAHVGSDIYVDMDSLWSV